jgi:hypothetical protein
MLGGSHKGGILVSIVGMSLVGMSLVGMSLEEMVLGPCGLRFAFFSPLTLRNSNMQETTLAVKTRTNSHSCLHSNPLTRTCSNPLTRTCSNPLVHVHTCKLHAFPFNLDPHDRMSQFTHSQPQPKWKKDIFYGKFNGLEESQ